MKEPRGAKKSRILNALLAGRVLTPYDANEIGKTTDGTRIIRSIREDYPVKCCRVPGELYFQYWIDKAYLAELREVRQQLREGTFFEKLIDKLF
jgi:hypothetical protein